MISDQVTFSSLTQLSSNRSPTPSISITSSLPQSMLSHSTHFPSQILIPSKSTMSLSLPQPSSTSYTTSLSTSSQHHFSQHTVVPFSSSTRHSSSLRLIQPTRVSSSTLMQMTQQTKLSVASGGGLQRSFSIVQQGWTTSKHSPTVTPDHIVDSDTPSYPTLTPSLAAQLGDNSVSTYIFIIAALLGLTIVSTTIAATAFCVVFAIGRKKSKPVVTVIYPSSHLNGNNSPSIVADESTCPHTVCNLEPVPIYEGASLVRGAQQNASQLQSCHSDTYLSGQTETSYISLTGEPASTGSVFTQPVLNPNYDRIENNRSNHSIGEQVSSCRQHPKPPVSPYEMVSSNIQYQSQ